MVCSRGFEIKVLKSKKGFFVGSVDKTGIPFCKLSTRYFGNKNQAEAALNEGFEINYDSFQMRHCCKV